MTQGKQTGWTLSHDFHHDLTHKRKKDELTNRYLHDEVEMRNSDQ
jgi:hypothetical protein